MDDREMSGLETPPAEAGGRAMANGGAAFRALLDAVPGAVLVIDRELRVRTGNGVAREWFPRAFHGNAPKCHDTVCGRPAACPDCPVRRAFGSRIPQVAEVTASATSERHIFEVRATLIEFSDGEELAVAFLRDLSGIRETERALHERLQADQFLATTLARFARSAPEALDGAIKWVLASLGRFLGAKRTHLFLVSRRDNTVSGVAEWCAEGCAPLNETMQDMPLDGFPWNVPSLWHAVLAPEELRPRDAIPETGAEDPPAALAPMVCGGTVLGYIGCDAPDLTRRGLRDVTSILEALGDAFGAALARERSRQRLAASEERYRTLFEASPDAVLYAGEDRRLVRCNAAACELFRCEPEALSRLSLADVLRDAPESLVREGAPLPAPGSVRTFEARGRRADGSVFEAELSTRALVESGKRYVMVQVRDVTDRKRAAAAMLQASRMEATATLAGGIAHDFNNLMVAVLGNAELLQMQFENEKRAQRPLGDIASAARRAADLAHQMLAFARGGKYESRSVDLNGTIAEAIEHAGHALPRTIDVVRDCDEGLWSVCGDRTQLEQIVTNLLMNAVEAMGKEGAVRIGTRNIHLDETFTEDHPGLRPGPHVKLTVEDSGCGIDKSALPRVFEPFFTTKFQGRGLGLAAVYGIVKSHGGYVLVNSEKGAGTAVTIYFPAEPAGAEEKPPAHDVELGRLSGTEWVLIVEDEQSVLDITQTVLDRFGYETLVARNGEEAVAHARNKEQPIDLVLLDLGMPVMSGQEAFPHIREARPGTPIVIMTGFEPGDTTVTLTEAGARCVIQKPCPMETLLRTVREQLDAEA